MNCLRKKLSALIPLVAFTSITTSSCFFVVKALEFNVIAPKGAPSLALLAYADDYNHVTIENNTANVKAAFFLDEYDIIIFDTFTGLKLIQDKGAEFKLARVITNGNLFLVSTGHDENDIIEPSDNILGFGEGLFPDRVFKATHPNLKISNYYNSAANAAVGLCNGEYEGRAIDYLVMSEPFIYNTLNNKSCSTYGKSKVVENIKETFIKFSADRGVEFNGFPQAGVFISNRLDETTDKDKKKKVDNFFKTIDTELDSLERSGARDSLKTLMDYGSLYEQENIFGLNYKTLEALQIDGKDVINKLSYYSFEYDIVSFAKMFMSTLNLDLIEKDSLSKYFG